MQTVDRAEFMVYSEGIFLDFKNGRGIAPNELHYEAAIEAMDRGETVALTAAGRIVSYMSMVDGEYYERI